MCESWDEFTEGRSKVVAVVDGDDPELDLYEPFKDVAFEVVPRDTFANKLRAATHRWQDRFEAVASWNDDHAARTPWESIHLDALNEMDGGIVYGNDLLQFDFLPTAPTISMSVVEALGWICPPGFKHMFIDNFWKYLGEQTGRYRYLPETIIEHVHAGVGKAEWDATYQVTQEPEFLGVDAKEWERYLRDDADEDIRRVKEALGCPV